MSDTSHRTTSEKQAVKRAKARADSNQHKINALQYYILHRWLPKTLRRSK